MNLKYRKNATLKEIFWHFQPHLDNLFTAAGFRKRCDPLLHHQVSFEIHKLNSMNSEALYHYMRKRATVLFFDTSISLLWTTDSWF